MNHRVAEETQRKLAAFDDLLAACEAVEASLVPYRGPECGPDKTYLCSRAAIADMRVAIAKAKPRKEYHTGEINAIRQIP